jgi:hypothetical protein
MVYMCSFFKIMVITLFCNLLTVKANVFLIDFNNRDETIEEGSLPFVSMATNIIVIYIYIYIYIYIGSYYQLIFEILLENYRS